MVGISSSGSDPPPVAAVLRYPTDGCVRPSAGIIKSRRTSGPDLIPNGLYWSTGAYLVNKTDHPIDQKHAAEGVGWHMVESALTEPVAEVRVQLDSNLLDRHRLFSEMVQDHRHSHHYVG